MFEEEYIETAPPHIREMVRTEESASKILVYVFTFVIMVLLVVAFNAEDSPPRVIAWVGIVVSAFIVLVKYSDATSKRKSKEYTGKRYRGEIIDKVVFESPAAGGEDTDYVYKVYFEGVELTLEKDSLHNVSPERLFDRIDVYPNNCVEIEHYPFLSLMALKVQNMGDKSLAMEVTPHEVPLSEEERAYFIGKDHKRFHKDLQEGVKVVSQRRITHKEHVWQKIATIDESGSMERLYRLHYEGGSIHVSPQTFEAMHAGQLLMICELPLAKYTWVGE